MNEYQPESEIRPQEIRSQVIHLLETLRSRHRGQAEGEDGLTLSARRSLYGCYWYFHFALDVSGPEWTFICEMPHLDRYTGEEIDKLADSVVDKVFSTRFS